MGSAIGKIITVYIDTSSNMRPMGRLLLMGLGGADC